MSEEAEVEAEVEVEVEAEPQYSEYETEAMDAGWNPEGKDKDGNTLSAKEYMSRKPLFNKIHNMKDEVESLKRIVSEVQNDSKKMAQTFIKEKESLLLQLKEKREKALDDLDTAEVRNLDKQIESVHAVKQPDKPEQSYSPGDWNKSYIGFLKANAWYDQSPGLKSAADLMGQEYMSKNPSSSPDDLYSYVAKEIKREFPDRFEEKEKPSKVSGATRRAGGGTKKKVSLNDFDAETQKVYEVMAKASGKTIEEYLNP